VKLSQSNSVALNKPQVEAAAHLKREFGKSPDEPVIGGGNIAYEVSKRISAICCGGLGVISQLVARVGLREAINNNVEVLCRHLPYHESDHVMAVAYNILNGGSRLEDIDAIRQDATILEALGASRVPDPTTVGDFTRRFTEGTILNLMEAVNTVRCKVWRQHRDQNRCRSKATSSDPHLKGDLCFGEAILDIDGTIAETTGECKAGMGLSYKGTWGYGPLLISLANTKEPLFLVNRGGNAASQSDAVPWLERAIALMKPVSGRVCLRGDSAFSLTEQFDAWTTRGIDFVLSYDSCKNLIALADALPDEAWRELERPAKYEVATQPRRRPENAKDEFVVAHSYKTLRLQSEQVAEFNYSPTKCRGQYRMVVVRKNIAVTEGQERLMDTVRYFFTVTNRTDLSPAEVVFFGNDRCDQENLIEQLKNGVHAMNMPVQDLHSNWAYMVMASLAWSLKAWSGLLMPNRRLGATVVKMEFRTFYQSFMLLPCQIIRSGRRLIYRVLGYNAHLPDWLDFSAHLRAQPRFRPDRC
jgi:hypothetical protein